MAIRKNNLKLLNDNEVTKYTVLRAIFRGISLMVAVSGLMGIIIFSCVHFSNRS